jgi:hypothetical protein
MLRSHQRLPLSKSWTLPPRITGVRLRNRPVHTSAKTYATAAAVHDSVIVGTSPNGYNIKVTKSKLARSVPLTRRAWEIVEAQMAGKEPGALLFTGARGRHLNSTYLRRKLDWSTISYGHRIHDLRHTAATNWLRAGVSAKTVSVWLGHSTTAITHRVYSGFIREDNDEYDLARLEQYGAKDERSQRLARLEKKRSAPIGGAFFVLQRVPVIYGHQHHTHSRFVSDILVPEKHLLTSTFMVGPTGLDFPAHGRHAATQRVGTGGCGPSKRFSRCNHLLFLWATWPPKEKVGPTGLEPMTSTV